MQRSHYYRLEMVTSLGRRNAEIWVGYMEGFLVSWKSPIP